MAVDQFSATGWTLQDFEQRSINRHLILRDSSGFFQTVQNAFRQLPADAGADFRSRQDSRCFIGVYDMSFPLMHHIVDFPIIKTQPLSDLQQILGDIDSFGKLGQSFDDRGCRKQTAVLYRIAQKQTDPDAVVWLLAFRDKFFHNQVGI